MNRIKTIFKRVINAIIYKSSRYMRIIDIKWAATNIPKDRYNILSCGKKSAIYKRYFKIFYVRVSKVYTEYDRYDKIIDVYNKLITKNK
jgi:hypothetical protein